MEKAQGRADHEDHHILHCSDLRKKDMHELHHDAEKGSVTDVSCPEAVRVDDIDGGAAATAYGESKRAFDQAEEGSEEKAVAQIDMEVNKAMAEAVGQSVA